MKPLLVNHSCVFVILSDYGGGLGATFSSWLYLLMQRNTVTRVIRNSLAIRSGKPET
jgi:hypothetical protein